MTRYLLILAAVSLVTSAARAADPPKLETLSAEEAERLEAAKTSARKSPALKEVNEKYKAARKAYQLDRAKFPADRDHQVAVAYHRAMREFDAAVLKLLAADPAIAPLLEKAERKRNPGENATDSDNVKNPAVAPTADVPGLPRVLLIGDSVSIGYTLPVRELLKGKANVHRIPVNGGATEVGLANIKAWLGDGGWDVIHFNFGLHDAKYESATTQRASREQYVENLRQLIAAMKPTGAKLIFATTTPVPKGGMLQPGRKFDSIEARNELAMKLMNDSGVAIDDLYAVALPVMAEVGRPNDVHFAPEGYALLAKAVAASIESQLPAGARGGENQSKEQSSASPKADIELTETVALPESHSIGWVQPLVRSESKGKGEPGWDGILDEAKWGVPSPQQVVSRHWDWKFTDEQWRTAVKERGEGKREDVSFALWVPAGVESVKGIVVISGHGSGEGLYRRPDLRALARELHLAIFKFLGNPMQRGFWPRSLLYERLAAFGRRADHPELEHAPLFLYGHSNGTGFSAIFPATEGQRVWGWISMRPGTVFQVYQPGAAQVPGLVIFGEDDQFLARPSIAENLAVVEAMRKKHNAVWNYAVEPKTGHGPGDKTWPLVFAFLRHTFTARVPVEANPRQGPVKLKVLQLESGWLGQNWDPAKGGYQTLPIAPYAEFTGDKSIASWLVDKAYAERWQAFQQYGQVSPPDSSPPTRDGK